MNKRSWPGHHRMSEEEVNHLSVADCERLSTAVWTLETNNTMFTLQYITKWILIIQNLGYFCMDNHRCNKKGQ